MSFSYVAGGPPIYITTCVCIHLASIQSQGITSIALADDAVEYGPLFDHTIELWCHARANQCRHKYEPVQSESDDIHGLIPEESDGLNRWGDEIYCIRHRPFFVESQGSQ